MYLWYFPRNTHQCSPLPTDKTGKRLRASHMMDCAAYEFWEISYKLSECPVCGKTYEYDHSEIKTDRVITYHEFNAILKMEKK